MPASHCPLQALSSAQGLPAEAAYHLAVQTALGSAQLAARFPEDPSVLIARVASKRGTTEAALKVLARRLPAVLAAGVAAAARRSEELSHVYSV